MINGVNNFTRSFNRYWIVNIKIVSVWAQIGTDKKGQGYASRKWMKTIFRYRIILLFIQGEEEGLERDSLYQSVLIFTFSKQSSETVEKL